MTKVVPPKRLYLALRIHRTLSAKSSLGEGEIDIDLPEGCAGYMLCFPTKKAARKQYGKNVKLAVLTGEVSRETLIKFLRNVPAVYTPAEQKILRDAAELLEALGEES